MEFTEKDKIAFGFFFNAREKIFFKSLNKIKYFIALIRPKLQK